jgi:leucyl aminopeptidase
MILAEGVNFARSLQVQPPNILTSVKLANDIKKYLSLEKNLSIKVLTKPEIIKNKMGLLLAVNSGSNYDARVVVIEYKGDAKSKEKQAFVGKGITFDAGGYNIKPGPHMIGMKYDMSAAAIIAASMKSIAKAKPKTNIVAVLCLTDNMVSKTSTVPDSIVHSMNGMSVEINNTDAEGRLVLADGITYAIRKCKATKILDLSTLTGAIIVALGKTYAGV